MAQLCLRLPGRLGAEEVQHGTCVQPEHGCMERTSMLTWLEAQAGYAWGDNLHQPACLRTAADMITWGRAG